MLHHQKCSRCLNKACLSYVATGLTHLEERHVDIFFRILFIQHMQVELKWEAPYNQYVYTSQY